MKRNSNLNFFTPFQGAWFLSCLLLGLTLVVWLTIPVAAETAVTVGTDASKYVLRGQIVTPSGTINGELVIEGDTLTCVAVTCAHPAGSSVLTVTNSFIFPGFIDAHNHVAYNFLPKWTPPKLYQNRGQWQRSQSIKISRNPMTSSFPANWWSVANCVRSSTA